MSTFRTITSFRTDWSAHHVTKYESTRTGMAIVVVDRAGPKVQGYFTLATEIDDDSGAPHTLEHLIFMGSRSYKYKGILDQLATRAYSETNAWTATDHTAYTLESAGWEGFRKILPVYLEHLLLPTLTDAGCMTEVYHVDGEANDAGVVYAEMQGVQNTQESLMNEAGNKMLYPPGIGFRYETGGMMEALRVLSPERIRRFHRDMYQPKNLCLVLVGEVDHKEMLDTLEKFEESVIDDIPDPKDEWKRPWVDSPQPPPLKGNQLQTVEFPEKDETMGEVMVAYLGPSALDPVQYAAMEVLSVYLAGSSVSVLESKLVEIEDPWASSASFYFETRPQMAIWIQLTSVETKKLQGALDALLKVLKETSENPLNFEYLKQIIRRDKRQRKYYAEQSGGMLSRPVINDHLFGKRDGSELKAALETLSMYDELDKWSEQQWRDYLKKWFVDNQHVAILGKPSAAMAKRIAEEDKKRVADRKEKLGGKGLEELRQKLEAAKAENEKEVPRSILEDFKVPDVDSIHFIKTQTARGGLAKNEVGPGDAEAQAFIDKDDVKNIPLYLHFEHVETQFVHLNLLISTAAIPTQLRPLASVYFENFFNTHVVKDGVRIEYEKVVSQLEDMTVDYSIDVGSYLDLPESIRIRFQIEPEKYQDTINWIRTLMRDAIFDKKRITVAVQKMISDIPDEKRDGRGMSSSVNKMIVLAQDSLSRSRDTLTKTKYLKRLNALLTENPDEAMKLFSDFNSAITSLENIRILVITDLSRLQSPVSSWTSFTDSQSFSGTLNPLDRRIDRLSPAGQHPGGIAHVIPLPSIDSSFGVHTAPGPSSYTDPDLPALMVALAYLGATEGPLWKAARGSGLAYGVNIYRHIDSGHISLSVYRSPDAFKAFKAVKELVKSFADGTTPIDHLALEGALSTIVGNMADAETNVAAAGAMAFVNQVVRGVGKDWNAVLLRKVREVKEEDVRRVLRNVVGALWDAEKSVVVVTSSRGKAEDIAAGFKEDGFKSVKIGSLKDFEDDYGLKHGVKEGEESEEEEESDDEEGSEGSEGSEDEDSDEDGHDEL